jgi:predicted transcriptional regulator with HTH domain
MKISEQKKEKIYEQILAFLFSVSPKPLFTSNIAKEIARDEEFVKFLLLNLKKKELIIEIKKNPTGLS